MTNHSRARRRRTDAPQRARPEAERASDDQLFSVFVDAVTDYAIYVLDPQGTIVSWNRGAERLTGYAADEAIGRHFSMLHVPEERSNSHPREVLRFAAEQGCHEEDGWRVRRDGSRFWAHVALNAVRGDDGRLVGYAKVMQDLTRQRSAAEELRASEERYRLLADMIPQHIWTTDPDGYHGYFSRRCYEFTGATLEETKGNGWFEFLHPDDRQRTMERWQHSLRTGEPYSIEYRFRDVHGEYHWFLGQAMPLRNAAGDIVRWFGTLTDISQRKQLDEERDRLLALERDARERVSSILERPTDAFFALDRDWCFQYVNRQAEHLLQRPREELLGRNLWAEFPEAVDSTFHRKYHEAIEQQTTVMFEEQYPPLGIWVDVRAYPSADGLSVFLRDVTDRKRAEQQLRDSERNFRALANSIPQLAWMADPSGSIFWYNDRWYDYTGTTLADVQGWGWQTVHDPAHVERVVAHIRHAFETGEPWEDTFPLRSRTGEYRWFLSRAVPIRDGAGHIVRWFGTNTDITEEINAAAERERLLRREQEARADAERTARDEQALREAVEAVGSSLTTEEVIQQIARSAIDATAASGAFAARIRSERREVEVVARAGEVPPQFGTFPYESSYARQAIDQRAPILVSRLGDFHDRQWLEHLPGRYRDWSMMVVPLISAENPIGALYLLREADGGGTRFSPDETTRAQTFGELAALAFRRLQLLEEAQRRREELERITESRARLIRGFSHDVKNPLGAADGYAALLEEGVGGALAPQQHESVRRIRRSIHSSLRLIGDLLELARAEAGQVELQITSVDVAALVRDVVEDFRAQVAAAGLELAEDVPASLTVESDPARVRQILGNLVSNAVKYTKAGRVTVTLSVRVRDDAPRRGEWVAISVADTGPGIPEDKREFIFQEFTRLDPDAPHGAGVGLAISRRLARLLRGDITVESAVGRGSTFTLWLPRGGATAQAARS